jgi:hypothetical protein
MFTRKPARRPSSAVVISIIALVLACSGTATAAKFLVSSGGQVKDGVLTGKDIKDRSITAKDLAPNALGGVKASANSTSAPGAAGTAGAKGDAGPAGAKGEKGDKGERGANGAAGAPGERGADGAAGAKGDKGEDGAKGASGAKGDTGAQGPQGPQGPKGDTGAQGAQGIPGPQGPQGAPGMAGYEVVKFVDDRDYNLHWRTVECPAGKRVITTGFFNQIWGDADKDIELQANYPMTSGQWVVEVKYEGDASKWTTTFYAVCASTTG